MDEKIKSAFHQTYVEEAKAALRLKVYAEKAEEDGYPQMAKLFRAIARSEEIHGTRGLRMLREIQSTEENLKASFESETRVADAAYDAFVKLANDLGDVASATVFSNSKDVEDTHARLYKEAMNHLMEERETTYFICKVCGYIADGVLPDTCPICSAKAEAFFQFD